MKKRRKKTERQKLIDENDNLFRDIIRKRDKRCQRSGSLENLQVCHYFTRKDFTTRWDLDNGCLLKAGIHKFWAHIKTEEFRDWWIARIGQERFDKLKLRNRYRGTIYTSDLKIIKVGLQRWLKDIV